MRFDVRSGALSLYDVYRCTKPQHSSTTDCRVGGNLRAAQAAQLGGVPKFAEFFTDGNLFKFECVKDSGHVSRPTPTLQSRSSLHSFLEKLEAGLKGQALFDFCSSKRTFLSDNADILQQLWPSDEPTGTPNLPQSQICPDTTDEKRSNKSFCYPSSKSLQKVQNSFEPPLCITEENTPGIFSTTCRIEDVDKLVTVVGVHTHSFLVNKTHKVKKEDTTIKVRVKYKCFRSGHHEASSNPSGFDRTQQDHEASSNPSSFDQTQQAVNHKANEVKRRACCSTFKCECPAYISGSYNPSCTEVALTLDLRHYNHEPGTRHDMRLLPLLPEVLQKVFLICQIVREKVQVKRMLSAWINSEFLPREFPRMQAENIASWDGRFNPIASDIKNCIAKGGKEMRLHLIDQLSTLKLFTSNPSLTWAFRPAIGNSLTYTSSPQDGLRASSVGEDLTIRHSTVLCETSSPALPAVATYLYQQHNKGDDEDAAASVKTKRTKSKTGNMTVSSVMWT